MSPVISPSASIETVERSSADILIVSTSPLHISIHIDEVFSPALRVTSPASLISIQVFEPASILSVPEFTVMLSALIFSSFSSFSSIKSSLSRNYLLPDILPPLT